MPISRFRIDHDNKIFAASLILGLATGFWLIYTWFYSQASWLHPELLGTAAYVLNNPDEGMLQTFSKIFDWRAFDPNVNRVRPLNDVIEVIDAMARPLLARLIGPHPSAMPSAILTAVLAPVLLFGWLRRTINSKLIAVMLTLLFISSTGFLSVIIEYIRPAKKLNMVFLCMALYFGAKYNEKGLIKYFVGLCLALIASFFSDEAGLANFVIIGVFYWKCLFNSANRKIALFYLSMPLIFILLTKYILPFIYISFSVHGAWDALADTKKLAVFKYLIDYRFYTAATEGLARSLLTTFGIARHSYITEGLMLTIFFGLVLAYIQRKKLLKEPVAILQDKLVLATIILVATSIYQTLLDWYPFPFEVSYLGSFNYYYHSAIVVSVIMWLATAIDHVRSIPKVTNFVQKIAAWLILLAGLVVISNNFILFYKVNKLVQIIHIYPYSNQQLWSTVTELQKNNSNFEVTVNANPGLESIKYKNSLKELFRDRWNKNGFYDVMGIISPNPIMSDSHLEHLFKSTFPKNKVYIKNNLIVGDGWSGITKE